ncbi:hypothetical protein ACRAWD_17570 [Caulobacter segnis]
MVKPWPFIGGAVQALLNQAAAQRKRGRKDLGTQPCSAPCGKSPNNPQVLVKRPVHALEDGDFTAGELDVPLRAVAGETDPRVVALARI